MCRRRKTPGDGPAEHRRAGSASRPIRVGSYVSAAATNNPSRGEPRGRNASPRRGQGRVACAVGTPRAPSGWGRDQGGRGLALRIRQIEANFIFRIPRSKTSDLGFVLESAADSPNRGRCGCGRAAAMRGVPLLGVARSSTAMGPQSSARHGGPGHGGGSSAAARSDAPVGRVAN